MIKASITLAVLSIVLSFLMSTLSAFPLTTKATTNSESSNITGGAEQVSKQFTLCYEDLINDIASFQDDPSLERAEARKEAFTDFARDLTGRYEGLSKEFGNRLDTITAPLH